VRASSSFARTVFAAFLAARSTFLSTAISLSFACAGFGLLPERLFIVLRRVAIVAPLRSIDRCDVHRPLALLRPAQRETCVASEVVQSALSLEELLFGPR